MQPDLIKYQHENKRSFFIILRAWRMHFYTTDDVAKELKISVGTLRNKLSNGDEDIPPSIRVGNRRLFPVEEFNSWVSSIVKKRLSESNINLNK